MANDIHCFFYVVPSDEVGNICDFGFMAKLQDDSLHESDVVVPEAKIGC
ncbi:hypothetical protein MUP77_16225 [Candidatus Bathyarchaeota archaeon]|nr:hypothetical protein [Candidatus Bathyarchaeota archaeon]